MRPEIKVNRARFIIYYPVFVAPPFSYALTWENLAHLVAIACELLHLS